MVEVLAFQSGTENFAIWGSLFWDKSSSYSDVGKTLLYKAEPNCVNTHKWIKLQGLHCCNQHSLERGAKLMPWDLVHYRELWERSLEVRLLRDSFMPHPALQTNRLKSKFEGKKEVISWSALLLGCHGCVLMLHNFWANKSNYQNHKIIVRNSWMVIMPIVLLSPRSKSVWRT